MASSPVNHNWPDRLRCSAGSLQRSAGCQPVQGVALQRSAGCQPVQGVALQTDGGLSVRGARLWRLGVLSYRLTAGVTFSGRLPALTTVGLFGAMAIVAQVLLLRESLVVVAGNELFIALFFGCWFSGIAIGAAVGSIWRPPLAWLVWLIAGFLLLQTILLPAMMIAIRGFRARSGIEAWQLVAFGPMLKMGLLHLAPFSFLTGLTFPMLCRLLAARSGETGRSIGLIFAVESFGGLIGGAVASMVFAVYVQPLTAAWILGALTSANLICFLAGSAVRAKWLGAAIAALFTLCFIICLISPIRPILENRSAALRHRAYDPGFQWLEERYTPYQHLALVRREDQYSLLSNGQFVATFPDPYTTSQTVHLMMSQAGATSRVLVVGGGETGLLRVLLKYPVARIDYVEIDPQILDLVRPYQDEESRHAFADPRVRIFHEDPRRFVRRRLREEDLRRPVYDVVLLNAPDPSTAALNRFYTREFFVHLSRLLADRGLLVTTIGSGVNYFDPEILNYTGSVYQSLHEVFGNVLATPGTEATLFATRRDDLLTSNVERLIARYENRGVQDAGFTPLAFHTMYEQDQLRLVNDSLRRSLGEVRSNTDLEPVTYLYHLRLWNRFSGARSQAFFSAIDRYDWRWAVAIIGALLLLRIVASPWLPLTSDRAAYLHAVANLFATGFAGMVASILLLLLYQNYHGSLYREIGLLIALFMAGLTLGSLVANYFGGHDKARLLGRMGLAAAAFWLFFYLLEKSTGGAEWGGLASLLLRKTPFYYIAMIAAGALTGVQFPLVAKLAEATGRDPGRAGGTLESVDHIGACLGAFVTGIVLIPVSGLAATMLVVRTIEIGFAVSLLLSAILLLRSARSS